VLKLKKNNSGVKRVNIINMRGILMESGWRQNSISKGMESPEMGNKVWCVGAVEGRLILPYILEGGTRIY